jgi:hypothetical protein
MNKTRTMCNLPNMTASDLGQTKQIKNAKVNLDNKVTEIFIKAEIELSQIV